MNVSLTPELEQFIREQIASGFYQTASEVVREGLRILQRRDNQKQRFRQKRDHPPTTNRRNHR